MSQDLEVSPVTVKIKEVSVAAQAQAKLKFHSLVELRDAPNRLYPHQRVWWPRRHLQARAIPDGILRDVEAELPTGTEPLESFFGRYSDGDVYVGNLAGDAPSFRHRGRYSVALCRWIKIELLSSPTCLISAAHNIVLLADEQLRYSVVGGDNSVIADLAVNFGGEDLLKEAFLQYIGELGIGFDEGDREWALRYLVSWSGWSQSAPEATL